MIAIYEPLYRPGQELREPAFRPLSVENTRPEWREFAIIVDMYRRGLHRQQTLTGLLSPKFRQKSGISGADFIRHIEANPGASVYILNAPAQLPYMSYNMWTAGEGQHPGLVDCAQTLLDACGIPWRLKETPRQGPDVVCYNNFWVATEAFWDGYVGGVLNPIATFVEQHPQSDVTRSILAQTYHRDPAPFLPFIAERLFSTYLSRTGPAIVPYLLDPLAACLSDFERDIVAFIGERVRRADREGEFPPDLIAWLTLLPRLRARYDRAYYAHHPHRYTGKPVDPAITELGESGLNAIPIDPLP
jgi:hypothetical protein